MKLLFAMLLTALTFHAHSMGIFRPKTSEVSSTKCTVNKPTGFEVEVEAAIKDKTHLNKLNTDKQYWVAVFKALAAAESCYNQTERYIEEGLHKDAVTGVQNVSEGFFQLSYQDSKYHGCAFDWSKDKSLALKDANKTIFNLKSQVNCAAIILNKQISKYGSVTSTSRYYWAVLDPKDNRHKVFLAYMKEAGF